MAEKADVVVNNVTYRDVPGIQLTAAGGGTVTYNLVDYPIAIEKGGTGATTKADALIQLGAVAKSGDTMTGDLQAIEIRATNKSTSDYATFAFKDRTTASGIIAGYVSENVSTRRILFGEYTPETNREVYFRLPELSSSDTAAGYDIVTTKGSYTMSGALTAKTLQTYNRGDNYASLSFKNTTTGSDNAAMNCYLTNNRLFITEYSPGTTYVERFYLPAPDSSRTAHADYNILTTKEHPAYTVQTLDWSSSNYINANYDVWVEKALDTVRFQGLFTFTNLTANTTVEIGTLPVGYRPNNRIERTIGISMQANWNTPATIGAQFVLVSVYSNGIVKINPGATPNTNSFWIDMTWAI